jgi:hypothetical protein
MMAGAGRATVTEPITGGSYLRDRQWGTVREDYSDSGGAWGSR